MLCKIYRKATSLKVLEQRAEMEAKNQTCPNSPLSSSETNSFVGKEENLMMNSFRVPQEIAMEEANKILTLQENAKNEEKKRETERKEPSSSLKLPFGSLPELQLPKPGVEWGPDQLLSISPWLQNLTPIVNLLNW